MSDDISIVKQQNVESAGEEQASEEKIKDNRFIKCLIRFVLEQDNILENQMIIPIEHYDSTKEKIAESLAKKDQSGILSLMGSLMSNYDWCHISVKSIIYVEMKFLEIVYKTNE